MRIRALGPQDLDLLRGVEGGLFDHPLRADQARAFLASPLHAIVVAEAGGRILAFASATMLLHPDKPPALFINEVATREGHRRQGLATAVCRALFALGRARGCQGIWVGAEPDNLPACALYRALGGAELPFVGFGWDDAFAQG